MIIGITETASGAHWAQQTLDITWEFVKKVTAPAALPENEEAFAALQRKLKRLNIGNPPCQPYSPLTNKISGNRYKLASGKFTPFAGNFMSGEQPDNIAAFTLDFDCYGCVWQIETEGGRKETIRISTGGTRFTNLIGKPEDMHQLYLCDGLWTAPDTFEMHCRWLETCLEDTFVLKFADDKIEIDASNNSPWKIPGDPIAAELAK